MALGDMFPRFRRDATPVPSHMIPTKLVLAGSCVIPIAVALVNYLMVVTDLNIVTYKFQYMHGMLQDYGLLHGTALLVGVCVALASAATAMVTFLAPACAGSGIPEVLSFLNGNHSPGVFTVTSFCVRVLGIVLIQGAGYPVGREGPMVGIGGCIGYGIASFVLHSYEKAAETVHTSSAADGGEQGECTAVTSSAYVASEEKITQIKRIGCAIGGAAGIATAFNAPIGGILYMMEEMAVSSLVPDLAKFMCTVLASVFARLLLNVTDMDVHRLVIYNSEAKNTLAWGWPDIPMFVLLASLLGCGGSCFCTALLRVWTFRRKYYGKVPRRFQSAVKISECMMYIAVCTTVWCIVPAIFDCTDDPASDASSSSGASSGGRRLAGDIYRTQYTCDDGQHNQLATLLLNSAEGAVKHLYSRADVTISSGPLLAGLAVYTVLAAGMPGLAVPMGTFVPNMLVGAFFGRFVGEQLQGFLGLEFASPGVYAAVGSAAMLSGFTHMTLGIVALLAEAINDFGLVAPLMLSAFLAHGFSTMIGHHGYDEELIIKKGVAFLDAEMPAEFDDPRMTAGAVAHRLAAECRLNTRVKVGDIKKALRHKDVDFYPIVGHNGDTCYGLTTRGRLRAVLSAVNANRKWRKMLAARGGLARRDSRDSNTSNNTDSTNQSDASAFTLQTEHSISDQPTGFERQTSGTSSNGSSGYLIEHQSSTASQADNRISQGALTDNATEVRVRDFIKTMFTRKPNDDGEECQPHAGDNNRLDLSMIADPAPFILYEDTPVARFYPMFKAGAPVVMVISRSGRFSGIISRRGLIGVAARLHKGLPAQAVGVHEVIQEDDWEKGAYSDTDTNSSIGNLPPWDECSDDTRVPPVSSYVQAGVEAMGFSFSRGSTPMMDLEPASSPPQPPVVPQSSLGGMQDMVSVPGSMAAELHAALSKLRAVEDRERLMKKRLAEFEAGGSDRGLAVSDPAVLSNDDAAIPATRSPSNSASGSHPAPVVIGSERLLGDGEGHRKVKVSV